MKKTLLSVAVAAALGVTSFSSMAALLTDGSAKSTYASEINRESTGSQLLPNAAIDFPAGYGIKTGTSLVARLDFTGAVVGTTALNLNTTMPGNDSNPTQVVSATVSQGGNPGDNYVIFGLTATGDLAPTEMFTLTNLQKLKIAAGATGVTMQYRLYNDEVQAVAGSDLILASASGPLFAFNNGIVTTGTPLTNPAVALVKEDFKKVNPDAAGGLGTLVNAGAITLTHSGAATTPVLDFSGTAIANAGIIIKSTNLSVQGDFSAIDPITGGTPAVYTNVFFSDDLKCGAGTIKFNAKTIAADNQSAVFTVPASYLATTAATPLYLCIQGDGIKSFAKSPYTASLINTVAQTNYSAPAIEGNFDQFGSIGRDGTVLHASFATTLGQPSRFIFINTGNAPAPITSYTLHMNDGVTSTTVLDLATTPLVIPPSSGGLGGRLPMKSTQIVSAFSVGTAYAISFNIAAPANTVFGTYQLLMPGSTVQTVVPLIAVGAQ